MENKEDHLEHISSESYKYQIDVWFKAYNISREKTELFHDFLLSLHELIEKTYMGSDVTITEEDQKNHFTWCWNKTLDNFSKERIHFKETGTHMEYLWNFFLEAFYIMETEGVKNIINEYFYKLFDFEHRKTRSELDILTEIYKILEVNLKS
jgi:hypothetical protein